MEPQSHLFKSNVQKALNDQQLQTALNRVKSGLIEKRRKAADRLEEFEDLRDAAIDIKNHCLEYLDLYLEDFEAQVKARGGHVHWCETPEDARQTILKICRAKNARTVTKGKSMATEEIKLNDFLEAHAVDPIETDLGEYIIQLRHETPSHIVVPAIHVNKEQITDSFREAHKDKGFDPNRNLEEPENLLGEAREVLRQKFIQADVGITGANFLIAETGSTVIVTNEGNGDLTQTLAKTHIVLAGIEKIVPTLEDASTLMRILARSATGQELSVYTSFSTGPKRPEDPDGPEDFHVVLLDHGRAALVKSEFEEILRCIRCGACLNHCPVYAAIGGHAYGWVYPGPVGSVLTPAFLGIENAVDLPNASTFCGRCESVCPMRIPLPGLMRKWREKAFERQLDGKMARFGLKIWGFFAQRPKLYHRLIGLKIKLLGRLGRKKGRFTRLPGASAWTQHRDFPAPQGKTFQDLWQEQGRARS